MILPLSYYGSAVLRKKAKPVEKVTDELKKLCEDMVETMDQNHGIGIAAPQVGVSLRLFVLRNYVILEDGEMQLTHPQVYINPKITIHGEDSEVDVEGCLSIPGIREDVERPLKLTVEATDLTGGVFVEEVEGYKARVILHENDHINGVLFIDRIDPKIRKQLDPELRAIKKAHPAK